MKLAKAASILLSTYHISNIYCLDVPAVLKGGTNNEYEKEATEATLDMSFASCGSCVVEGREGYILDGIPSTEVVVEAKSDADKASSNVSANLDFKYESQWMMNHLVVKGEGFGEISVAGKNKVDSSWNTIRSALDISQVGIGTVYLFNHMMYNDYRVTLKKKASSETIKIQDVDFVKELITNHAASTYYKLKGTKFFHPSVVNMKMDHIAGMVEKPSQHFIIQYDVVAFGKLARQYGMFYRFRSNPLSTADNQEVGARSPASWFCPNSFSVYTGMVQKNKVEAVIDCRNVPDEVTANQKTTITTTVIGDIMKTQVGDRPHRHVVTMLDQRPLFEKLYLMILMQYGHGAPNAKMSRFSFTSLYLKESELPFLMSIGGDRNKDLAGLRSSGKYGGASRIATGPIFYMWATTTDFSIDYVTKFKFKDTDNYWSDWFNRGYKDCKPGYLVRQVTTGYYFNSKIRIRCAPVEDKLIVHPLHYGGFTYHGRRSCGHNISNAGTQWRYFSGMEMKNQQGAYLIPRCSDVERKP